MIGAAPRGAARAECAQAPRAPGADETPPRSGRRPSPATATVAVAAGGPSRTGFSARSRKLRCD